MSRRFLPEALLGALLLLLSLAAPPAGAHGDEDHSRPQIETTQAAQSAASEAQGPDQAGAAADPRPVEAVSPEPNALWSAMRGLHPATVHFPIAFLLLAALLELAGMRRPSWRADRTVAILLWAGAAGAVVAAGFGWIHTGLWVGGGQDMRWHRWIGSLLAPASLALAWLATRRREGRGALRLLLLGVALAVSVQGYLGGELAHGPDHLGNH